MAVGPAGAGQNGPQGYTNLRLALISLSMALFVWVLAKQTEIDSDNIIVNVRLANVPDYLDIKFVPDQLETSLRFPKALRGEMLSSNFAIEVDAGLLNMDSIAGRGQQGPLTNYSVRQGNFRILDPRLPSESISLIRLVPETIQISAAYIGENAEIRPNIVDQPAPGFIFNAVRTRVRPREVFVAGPRANLEAARDEATKRILVHTRPFSLDGMRETSARQLDLDLPAGLRLADPSQARVEAVIVIDEVHERRVLQDVPFRIPHITKDTPTIDPPTAVIEVDGPRSLVDAMTGEHFRFVLMRSIEEGPGNVHNNVPLEARVAAPRPTDPLAGRESEITVLSISPPAVRILWPAEEEQGS